MSDKPKSPVTIGRTLDESTVYAVEHNGLVVIVDVYDSGSVVLLVEKDGFSHVYEIVDDRPWWQRFFQ